MTAATSVDLTDRERAALAWVADAEPSGRIRGTEGIRYDALPDLKVRRLVWVAPALDWRKTSRWRLTIEGAATLAAEVPA